MMSILRKFAVIGKSKTDNTLNVIVRFNGNEVFSDNVNTLHDMNTNFSDIGIGHICEFLIASDIQGEIPLEISITGGEIEFIAMEASGLFLDEDNSTVKMAEATVQLNTNNNVDDGKSNVMINNIIQDPIMTLRDGSSVYGDYHYVMHDNDTLTANIKVDLNILDGEQIDNDGTLTI